MFEETGETIATGARAAMLYKLKKGVELINFSEIWVSLDNPQKVCVGFLIII